MFRRIIALICFLLLFVPGCGTMYQFDAGPAIYGGVQMDLYVFYETQKSALTSEFWFGVLAILDIPFSFVLDTLILPIVVLLNIVN